MYDVERFQLPDNCLAQIVRRIPRVELESAFGESTLDHSDDTMRKQMAEFILRQKIETRASDYYIERKLEVVVMSVEEFYKCVHYMAKELARSAP